MNTLTAKDHESLKSAIQSLEKNVLGELVVVIARSSDAYRFIPTLWAALIALSVPGIYLLWQWISLGGWPNPDPTPGELTAVYVSQVTVFFGFLMLFHWGPIKRLVIPKSVLKRRASRCAREQFLAQQLHHTNNRCGTLVFISLLEHHVEILVDQGLATHVDNGYWENTVSTMIPLLKQGHTANACEVAISAVAIPMKKHAPRGDNSLAENELPDHVVEI